MAPVEPVEDPHAIAAVEQSLPEHRADVSRTARHQDQLPQARGPRETGRSYVVRAGPR